MDDEAARERFGMIPLRAAREAGLAGCDYRVLIVIASHANERGFAWPSLKTIASLARTTVPKVSPAIKKLEAAGLLRKQNRVTARGDWNSNVYQVLLQKGVPTAGCGSRVVPSDGTGTAWGGNRTDQGTDQRTETPPPAREGSALDAYRPGSEFATWAAVYTEFEKHPEFDPFDPEILEDFRDYYRSEGKTSADLEAAFRRWVRKELRLRCSGRNRQVRRGSRAGLIETALNEVRRTDG